MKNELSGGGELSRGTTPQEVPFSGEGPLGIIMAPMIMRLRMSSETEQRWRNSMNDGSPLSQLRLQGCPLLDVSPKMDRMVALIRELTGEDILC